MYFFRTQVLVCNNNNPVTVETLGPFDKAAYKLVGDLGRCITRLSGNDRESSFLFQCLSVVVQRFNKLAKFSASSWYDKRRECG